MFMLPFFQFTDGKVARNLLKYRVNTLEGAKRKAKEDFLPLSPSMLKEQLEVYIAFVADDRLQAANSIYLGSLSPV